MTDVRELLSRPEFVVSTTHELARASGSSSSAVSHALARASRNGFVTAITRGVWANTLHPWFEPMACVPAILGNEQGYVSFLSALYRHGILSQIPTRIQVATTGTPRLLRTPVAVFEMNRIKPELHREGVQWSQTKLAYRIASAEKALLDTLYISTRRGRRFSRLPELELESPQFESARFEALVESSIPDIRIRSAVRRRFERLLTSSAG